ncbi:hypothetical protein EJB05_24020, partial [Eragrostis curvula]
MAGVKARIWKERLLGKTRPRRRLPAVRIFGWSPQGSCLSSLHTISAEHPRRSSSFPRPRTERRAL